MLVSLKIIIHIYIGRALEKEVILVVVLNEGLERLAVNFASDITNGQWGSGTTLPTTSDTGLETAIGASLLAVTASSSGTQAQFNHEVDSVTANGNTFAEFELQFSNGDSFNRVIGGTFAKTSSVEVVTITTVSFIRSS